MDPSIMKLLEDDEDENIHSGADVDAFTAALNRDIEGDTSTSQLSDSDAGTLSHTSNPTSNQMYGQWQSSSQEENATLQNKQEELQHLQPKEHHSSDVELVQQGTGAAENQSQQIGCPVEHDQLPLQQKQPHEDEQNQQPEQKPLQFSEKNQVQVSEKNPVQRLEQDRFQHSESQNQYSKLQQLNNQQAPAADQANNQIRRSRPNSIPFAMLIPALLPQLDKDRSMQLQAIFAKLRGNEVSKDDFLRVIKNIVGDQMLRQAAHQIQIQTKPRGQGVRNSQTNSQQYQLQSQASSQQHTMPARNVQQFTDAQAFSQMHSVSSAPQQKVHRSPPHQPQILLENKVQMQTDSCFPTPENSSQKAREMEHQSDGQGWHVSQISSSNMNTTNQEREIPMATFQAVNKQQHHLHHPQTSFPMYGGAVNKYPGPAYSGPSVSTPANSLKAQTQESQIRQLPALQGMVSTQLGGTQPMNLMTKYELQNSMNESKRLHGGSLSHLTSHSSLQQNPIAWQSSLNKEQKGNTSSTMAYVKQEIVDQTSDQQHRPPMSTPVSSSSFGVIHIDQGNPAPGTLKDETTEKQSTRMGFSTSTSIMATHQISSSVATQLDPTLQMRSHVPSATTPVGAGISARTPPKKPSIGQKKPLETLGTPLALQSKKQKVSGAFLDQSIEQLNDVTAVSGVNLREEEEQLLSGPKEESRASEATRRVVQEEEERLILQKGPLQKKIAEIMSKCGIKNRSNDVERCLSMCVEERMRGLISNLIRLSKQRADIEKQRHRICFVTSDVRQQILLMNRKAKEDWDKKQAEETEKLRKLNEAEGNTDADVAKDKDEGRMKALKANKEEDDKMRTTAANVAARAAVGGDDMLSKWQLMAEQARQKREGGLDGASGAQQGKDVTRNPKPTSGKTLRDNQETESKGPASVASGAMRKLGRNPVVMPQSKVVRSISVKDVVAVLEREPQMSKSTMIYRLYERMHADAIAE